MPKRQTPESKPKPNDPTGPKVGTGLDLSAFRHPSGGAPAPTRQRDAKTPTERAEREARPRVKWEDLVGIDGLRLLDVWSDENETYGEYVGAVVRLPAPLPSGEFKGKTDVVVLTNSKTRAGKTLAGKLDGGAFDEMDGEGAGAMPVTARAKKSRENPDGRPMVILRFPGEGAESD